MSAGSNHSVAPVCGRSILVLVSQGEGEQLRTKLCFCLCSTLKFPAINMGAEQAADVFLLSSDPDGELERVQ